MIKEKYEIQLGKSSCSKEVFKNFIKLIKPKKFLLFYDINLSGGIKSKPIPFIDKIEN